jgi:hypothetical protein
MNFNDKMVDPSGRKTRRTQDPYATKHVNTSHAWCQELIAIYIYMGAIATLHALLREILFTMVSSVIYLICYLH